ncbi:MAG: quinolinate synthase NadA [candidate division WOR-3 bacterium]
MDKETKEKIERILELKEKKNVLILAHNYQIPEIQDIADFVGDSLGLSQRAKEADKPLIVFCGVLFMAETAKILNPDKKVLIPDLEAGCSLVNSITLEELKKWKEKHKDAVVVGYINTSAEVKAECDYICTSSNAVKVIEAIPEDKEILFLPDMFLGFYIQSKTKRKNIHIWPGECHVHAAIRLEDIKKAHSEHKNAELLIHPECGCSTSCMFLVQDGTIKGEILSTSGMIKYAKNSNSQEFVVATEIGILHPLRKSLPNKSFYPVSENAICEYMKKITVDKLLKSLEEEIYEVIVPEEIMEKARKGIERMLSIC